MIIKMHASTCYSPTYISDQRMHNTQWVTLICPCHWAIPNYAAVYARTYHNQEWRDRRTVVMRHFNVDINVWFSCTLVGVNHHWRHPDATVLLRCQEGILSTNQDSFVVFSKRYFRLSWSNATAKGSWERQRHVVSKEKRWPPVLIAINDTETRWKWRKTYE